MEERWVGWKVSQWVASLDFLRVALRVVWTDNWRVGWWVVGRVGRMVEWRVDW